MHQPSTTVDIPLEISIIYFSLHLLYRKGYEPDYIFKKIEELTECNKEL